MTEPADNQPAEPSQDARLADYYKGEFEKMKAEVRELVLQRDLHKNEALELKQKHSRSKSATESAEYRQLFEEHKTLKEQLDAQRKEQELSKKKSLFVNKAKQAGMSEEALGSLDMFNINYDAIDPNEEISAEILVESLKKKSSFLFQEKRAVPNAPQKLVEGDQTNKEKYMKLIEDGKFFEAKKYLDSRS
jgi:hypothetical protein